MSMREQEYVLGTGEDELARLGFQHQVWAAPTNAVWERAGFAPGTTILDVGCGPGYASFDLANLVGRKGRVIAVDVSQRFISYLDTERRRRGIEQIETRVQDLESLDVEAASAHGAFARWVLCFVRDPDAVVQRVARALRPGGAFAVMDYCQYESFMVAPRHAAIDGVIGAVARSFRRYGGDPDIGSRLPAIMRRAGLEVESVQPLVRLARPGSALWSWPATFFANYLPTLVQMGEIDESQRAAFEDAWKERSTDGDAFLLTPPMVEIIGRRKA